MAPASWATAEEWDWMTMRNLESTDASKHGRYAPWFNGVSHDWFVNFSERKKLYGDHEHLTPEEEAGLAEAIKARCKQLANWFHNHCNPTRQACASPYAVAAQLRKGGRKRAPQVREVYCRLFYDDEQKTAVQEQLKDAAGELGRKLTRGETMAILHAHIDTAFRSASEDVKAQVATHVTEEKQSLIAAASANDTEREPTPEEYQAAIQAGPGMFQDLLKPAVKAHGWVFTLVGAGPCPEEGRQIRSYAVHFGQNQIGHTLPQAMPDFREKIIKPMIHFAKGVFPREVRDSRALRTFSEDMETDTGSSSTKTSTDAPSCRLTAITNTFQATSLSDLPPTAVRQTAVATPLAVQTSVSGPSSSSNAASSSHVAMELDSSTMDIPSLQSMSTDLFNPALMFSGDMYAGLGPAMNGVGSAFGGAQFGQFGVGQFGVGQFGGGQYGGGQFGGGQFGGGQFGGGQFGGGQKRCPGQHGIWRHA
ncbi:hypothetical protein C8T65DRAFT_699288 [Cerioporus squamosus]|nr:hypothetical protein C8T65DRAFT_699288 [Cerioporus squamosus]